MTKVTVNLSDELFKAIKEKYPSFCYRNAKDFVCEAVQLRVEGLLKPNKVNP